MWRKSFKDTLASSVRLPRGLLTKTSTHLEDVYRTKDRAADISWQNTKDDHRTKARYKTYQDDRDQGQGSQPPVQRQGSQPPDQGP
jgi:hypothetical protein